MDIVTQNQINILIQLAHADNHFAKEERALILKIASDHDFPEEKVMHLLKNPLPIESLGALSVAQKFECLLSCVDLILADRKIFDSEIKFCQNIAINLGFKKNVVDFMLDNTQIGATALKSKVFEDYG